MLLHQSQSPNPYATPTPIRRMELTTLLLPHHPPLTGVPAMRAMCLVTVSLLPSSREAKARRRHSERPMCAFPSVYYNYTKKVKN